MSEATESYFETRLPYDRRRRVLWQVLARHVFQAYVPSGGTVLELGAGYCDFINSIEAAEKYALDIWPGMAEYADAAVKPIIGDVTAIDRLAEGSVDLIFASNLFEHLDKETLAMCLGLVRRKLRRGGRLIALQPNYRYAYREYFDDYTHVSVWSHVSLSDYLGALGFVIERVSPRFLPLTIKSRLPVLPILIRAYLASPIKPMAKQMLLVATTAG
jgi:SAM-dependent methyltransferase